MKKPLIVVLTLALLLSMTACGGGSTAETVQPDDKPTVSDTQTETETPTVADDSQQEQEQPVETPEPEQEETPVEQEPAPIPEQTTNSEPSVEPAPAPEVKPEQTVTPETEQEPAPVVKPEPTPEQTVAPTPTSEPAPEVETEQPVVIPEPEQEPDFEIVITPEVTPVPEPTPEAEATGAQTWVEGEMHEIAQEGDIIITADGVKHTITRDPISGVLGAGLDVYYDIWTGYPGMGKRAVDMNGQVTYGYVRGPGGMTGYDGGIIGRDSTSLLEDPVTGQIHTGFEWNRICMHYRPSYKGEYEGQIANNWYQWHTDINKWVWHGPVG